MKVNIKNKEIQHEQLAKDWEKNLKKKNRIDWQTSETAAQIMYANVTILFGQKVYTL